MTELKPVQVVNPVTGYGETKSVEVGLSPGQTSGTVGGVTVNRPAGSDTSKPYYPSQPAEQPTPPSSQLPTSGFRDLAPKPFLDTHPLNPPSQTVQMGMVPDFGFASSLPKPAPISGIQSSAQENKNITFKMSSPPAGVIRTYEAPAGTTLKSFWDIATGGKGIEAEQGKYYVRDVFGSVHEGSYAPRGNISELGAQTLETAATISAITSPFIMSKMTPSEGIFTKGQTIFETKYTPTPTTELKELTGFKQETSVYTPKGEPPSIESKITPRLKTSYEIKPSDVTKDIKGTYPVEFKGSVESGGLETFSGKGMFEYRGKEPVITIGAKGNEPIISSEMQDIGKLTPSEIKYDFYTKWGDSELTQSKINMKILKTYQEPTSGLENLAKDTSATTFPSRFPKMIKQPQMAQLEYEQIPSREIFPNAPSVQGLSERVIVSSRELPITTTGYYPILSIPNINKVIPTFDIKTGITDITKPVTGLAHKQQQEIWTPTTPSTALTPELGTTEIVTPRIITPQLTPQLTKTDIQTATEFDFNFRPNKPFYPQIPIPGLGGGGGPEKKRWFKYFRTFRASPIAAPSVTMSDVGKTMAKEMSKGMSVEYKKSRKRKK